MTDFDPDVYSKLRQLHDRLEALEDAERGRVRHAHHHGHLGPADDCEVRSCIALREEQTGDVRSIRYNFDADNS